MSKVFPSIMIALAALISLTGCGVATGKAAAERAVADFHAKLDHGDFPAIFADAHADFKKASTEKDFVALLAAVHRKLGPIKSSALAGWRVGNFNFQTTANLTYKTKFRDGDGTESFVYRIKGDKASLYGYNINSLTLMIK